MSGIANPKPGLEEAFEVVANYSSKLKNDGLSKATFFIGVVNVILTTFIVGRFPEHYWLYHTLKASVCFTLLIQRRFAARTQFYLLDFCWIANFVILIASLYLLYDWWTPGFDLSACRELYVLSEVSDEWELYFYLLISTTAA
eukprot:gene17086-34696_t